MARRAGVRRQSVNRGSPQMAESGKSGLNKAGRAGRKLRLSRADLKKIESGLKHGPEVLGYDTQLWTAWRVAHWIEEKCGVRFHPGHAGRILRQLGWSCQWPTGRALERDEAAIRVWQQKRWPKIKKSPACLQKAVTSCGRRRIRRRARRA